MPKKLKTLSPRDAKIQKLKEDLTYWKKQLRLQNWKFYLRLIKWDKKTGFAYNSQDPNYETSYITLADPDTIPAEIRGVRDMEVTLVHEMLHTRLIYVAPLSNKKKKKWPVEIAVETIAQSLVANRRGIDLEELK